VESVGLVPVGLTGYRAGLYPLRSFEKQEIIELINQVERWQEKLEKEKGSPWVYIADEFYIAAGHEFPPVEHYGDFPQIENGIGLSRLFIDEVEQGFGDLRQAIRKSATTLQAGQAGRRIALVTGELFANILRGIAHEVSGLTGAKIDVIPVENGYFGGKVNVTGLLTGRDIVASAKLKFLESGKPDILVLPDVIVNDDGVMLDGASPGHVADELDVEVKVFKSSGDGFIEGFLEVIET
jgi:NifB/MoaA-like Fe-S oxidoreductase